MTKGIKLNRYVVLIVFIAMSVILFLAFRIIEGFYFDKTVKEQNIGDQFIAKLYFTFKFLGYYILILMLLAISGKRYWKKKGNHEYAKGFSLSLLYTLLIAVLFILFLIYLFYL